MKSFNIKLSSQNQKYISQIKIDNDVDPFRHYEAIKSKWISFDSSNTYTTIFNGIKEASDSNSDHLAKKASTIISKIISKAIHTLKQDMNINRYHTLIHLRFETPNTDYDLPRWHTDGKYVINGNTNIIKQKKIIISLQGPGTVFARCNNNLRIIQNIRKNNRLFPRYDYNTETGKLVFNPLNAKSFNETTQSIIDTHCQIIQLNNFQGMMYEVGDSDNAGIHSEPIKNKNRIMLAILLSEIKNNI